MVEDDIESGSTWDKGQLGKLHIQLRHADIGVMRRILNHAEEKVEDKVLAEVVQTCGCKIDTGTPQPPRIAKYVATCPGEVIALDVYYPSGNQSEPAIICVDSLTIYVASRFITSIRRRTIISFLMTCWVAFLGVPPAIMVGRGTPFMGPDWGILSHTCGAEISTAPTRAHYQMGLAERNSPLLKTLFMAQTRENPTGWSRLGILALACLARNLSPPIKSGIPPLHLLTGRNDAIQRLLNATPPAGRSSSSKDPPGYETMVWPRMKMLLGLILRAISADSKQILFLAQSKNLRARASESFEYGDAAQLYDDQTKTWQGTLKMIFNSGRNCYVER